jgi:hypothetical protein
MKANLMKCLVEKGQKFTQKSKVKSDKVKG